MMSWLMIRDPDTAGQHRCENAEFKQVFYQATGCTHINFIVRDAPSGFSPPPESSTPSFRHALSAPR